MPLTPKFGISQTDEFLIIEINVPYVRVGDMEFVIDDCDFSFFCNPYLLKLHFPYPCIDDERAKAVYDVDKNNGTVYVHIPKVEKGQFFPDLDMISTLLQKPTPMPTLPHGPLIEEMDAKEESSKVIEEVADVSKDLLSLEDPSKQHRKYGFNELFENVFSGFEDCSEIIENPLPDDSTVDPYEMMRAMESSKFSTDHYLSDYVYGKQDYLYTEFVEFLPSWVLADRVIRKKNKETTPVIVPFSDLTFTSQETISAPQAEIPKKKEIVVSSIKEEPKKVLITEITTEENKMDHEKDTKATSDDQQFVSEQVKEKKVELLDVTNHVPSLILTVNEPSKDPTPAKSEKNPIQTISSQMRNYVGSHRFSHEEEYTLTEEEKQLITSIRPVPLSIPKQRRNTLLFSLVDILCAYCYDTRMTQNDPNTESAWTISILSPTLSWLVPSSSLLNVLVSFIRRVLIYPYLRRYDLARLCIKDCALILKLGKRRVLKCLLEIKKVFKYSERKYILNTLYIDKYILWIQTVDYPLLYDLSEEINYLLKTAVNREVLDLGIPELDLQGKEILKEEMDAM